MMQGLLNNPKSLDVGGRAREANVIELPRAPATNQRWL